MNWDAIGAIGQILGSLAVFITLGYLAVQVRHARDETRRSTVLARLHGVRDMYVIQATDERVTPLMVRTVQAMLGPTPQSPTFQYFLDLGLSVEEVVRLNAFSMAIWQNFEATFETMNHMSAGVMLEADNSAIASYGQNPLGAKWFEMTKARLNPEAVRHVERLLAQPGSTP